MIIDTSFTGALTLSTLHENVSLFWILFIYLYHSIFVLTLLVLSNCQTYIWMSDTSFLPWSVSTQKHSLSSADHSTKCYLFRSGLGKWAFFPLFFSSPCSTSGSAGMITSTAELQMSVCRADQSHFFFLVCVALLWGSHPWLWDWGGVLIWMRMNRRASQVWPLELTEISENTRQSKNNCGSTESFES